MKEIDIFRNSHLVDPQLHIWGWQIPVYLFLRGLTAGVMILAPLLSRRFGDRRSRPARWLAFLAPLLLSAGLLALLLDLELKVHVFRFYTTFRWTSPMSWGAWILVLIYPVTLLLGLANLTVEEVDSVLGRFGTRRWRWLARSVRRLRDFSLGNLPSLETASAVLGVALGAYTGILLGTLGARPLWNSGLLGPLFLVSGVSTGVSLVMLLSIRDEEHQLIRSVDIAAIGLELILLALFFVDLLTSSGQLGRQAALLFFGGSSTASFWALVVIAGLAVPLYLELHEARHRMHAGAVAPLLLLVGGLALRWILVSAGQTGM